MTIRTMDDVWATEDEDGRGTGWAARTGNQVQAGE